MNKETGKERLGVSQQMLKTGRRIPNVLELSEEILSHRDPFFILSPLFRCAFVVNVNGATDILFILRGM